MSESVSRLFGRHRRRTLVGVFFVFTVGVWLAFFSIHRFVDRDAYDYAQIGRQVRQGHGYTTRQIFPRHIPYIEQKGTLGEDWPSLLRYPVSPTLNALAQRLVADPVQAAVVQSGVCFLLSVPLFFLLAARLTDSKWASVATVFYVGDPRIWRDSYNGMTESVALLVVLAVFYLGFLPATREGRNSIWATLGLLCGLAYLTRTQLIVLVPLGLAVAAFAVRVGARRRSAFLFLTCALLAISPWLMRNFLVTGDPLFAFTNSRNFLARTATHSSIDRYLHEPVDVGTVLTRYHGEIFDKVVGHFWPNVVDPSFWFEALGVYAAVFPALVLALALRRWLPPVRREFILFERVTLLLLLSNFIVVCLIYHRQRYYDTMIPLLAIVIVQRVGWMLSRIKQVAGLRMRRERLAFLALFILAVGRWAVTLEDHRAAAGVPTVDLLSYELLDDLVEEESVVLSDLSAQVTLYNGNRTIRQPMHPEEVFEIDARYLQVDHILLSQRALNPRYRAWIASADFRARFEFWQRLPNGALLFRKIRSAAL